MPLNIRESPSLSVFKNRICPKLTTPTYFTLCSGKYGVQLTRLRLGLSALNEHRFKYNFIDSPVCSLCNRETESTTHFFFKCPAHDNAREILIESLTSDLHIDITDATEVLQILLYGTQYEDENQLLLHIIYDYLQNTDCF